MSNDFNATLLQPNLEIKNISDDQLSRWNHIRERSGKFPIEKGMAVAMLNRMGPAERQLVFDRKLSEFSKLLVFFTAERETSHEWKSSVIGWLAQEIAA